VRRDKGGRHREVGMDEWAWEHLQRWIDLRLDLPVGPLFCVINGATRGRSWSAAAARAELRRTAATAGVRRRFAPHQLRHAHAVEMAHEGVPLIVIQRQLGHSNLGITPIYLQGIDNAEIIRRRPPPPRAHDPGQRNAPTVSTRRVARRAKQQRLDGAAWALPRSNRRAIECVRSAMLARGPAVRDGLLAAAVTTTMPPHCPMAWGLPS
jgi:hypothetical protein